MPPTPWARRWRARDPSAASCTCTATSARASRRSRARCCVRLGVTGAIRSPDLHAGRALSVAARRRSLASRPLPHRRCRRTGIPRTGRRRGHAVAGRMAGARARRRCRRPICASSWRSTGDGPPGACDAGHGSGAGVAGSFASRKSRWSCGRLLNDSEGSRGRYWIRKEKMLDITEWPVLDYGPCA